MPVTMAIVQCLEMDTDRLESGNQMHSRNQLHEVVLIIGAQ